MYVCHLTQKSCHLKSFYNQPQLVLKPSIPVSFAISKAFNWHVTLHNQIVVSHLNMRKVFLLHLKILLSAHKNLLVTATL